MTYAICIPGRHRLRDDKKNTEYVVKTVPRGEQVLLPAAQLFSCLPVSIIARDIGPA
jgi:hypothetical protein